VLWVCHTTPLNAEVLDAAGPRLKALSTLSSGVDYVDVAEFKRRGIQLGHTPAVLNDTVADLAVGLMIAAGRGFRQGRLALEQKSPDSQRIIGMAITGSIVGIIGFGGVGQAIAKRLQGFDVGHLLYSGHLPKLEAQRWNAEFVTLDILLQKSDFVILACPLTEETQFMFNVSRFKQMKPTSVFVNVARGRCVDQEALFEALNDGYIFAAGIDAMYPEPLPANHPLMGLPNLCKFLRR
jgi:glyoxylate/hydroxypyruvate reductase